MVSPTGAVLARGPSKFGHCQDRDIVLMPLQVCPESRHRPGKIQCPSGEAVVVAGAAYRDGIGAEYGERELDGGVAVNGSTTPTRTSRRAEDWLPDTLITQA